MNKLYFLTMLVLVSYELSSQDIQVRVWNDSDTMYNAEIDFPPEGVADDFGPRLAGRQHFHLGIDYNTEYEDVSDDMWDMIVAPENGTIVDVNRMILNNVGNDRYKQLCYEAVDSQVVSKKIIISH